MCKLVLRIVFLPFLILLACVAIPVALVVYAYSDYEHGFIEFLKYMFLPPGYSE